MSKSITHEFAVGNNFLDDDSSEGERESNVSSFIQTFAPTDGIPPDGLSQDVYDQINGSRRRTKSRRSTIASLPKLLKSSVYGRGSNIKQDRADDDDTSESLGDRSGSGQARQMSLRRLDKDNVRLVHTSSSVTTPKQSTIISHFDSVSANEGERTYQFPSPNHSEDQHTPLPMSPKFGGEHRRNTSESTLADSVINAHMMTLRVLESRDLPPTEMSPPYGYTHLRSATTSDFPRSSYSSSQRMAMSPLLSTNGDRFAYLPSLLIRTSHSSDTEEDYFIPKSRPSQSCSHTGIYGQDREEYIRLGSLRGMEELRIPSDGQKGKRMLGLESKKGDRVYSSEVQRNESTEGFAKNNTGAQKNGRESMIWLKLQRHGRRKRNDDVSKRKMIGVIVPGVPSLDGSGGLEKTVAPNEFPTPFDDKCLAENLQSGYRKLAGSWFRRTFGVRRLRTIRLSQCSIWSGSPTSTIIPSAEGLLARGDRIYISKEGMAPLTEEGLMKLFREPNTGEAKYTWVHWARRVAAANTSAHSRRPSYQHEYTHVCNSNRFVPSAMTTIEFLHTPCIFRILCALTLVVFGCVMAALLWIFVGPNGTETERDVRRQMSERVGGGMGIGVLVLLLEGGVFWMWLVLS